MSEEPQSSEISINWRHLWEFMFRVVTGVGLVTFWLILLVAVLAAIVWLGVTISNLSLGWILGVIVTVPILLIVWWLCFFVALDALSALGITLRGVWSWIVLPVAPLLAPVCYCLVYLYGIGQMAKERVVVVSMFAAGCILLLALVIRFGIR